MAFDVTKPATTDNYLTQFTQGIRANLLALAVGLDSVQSSFTGAVPTYAKRYNRSSKAWEEYNGTSWGLLPFGNLLVEGTITGTLITGLPIGGGNGGKVSLQNTAGGPGGFLSVGSSNDLTLLNQQSGNLLLGSGNIVKLSLDSSGNLLPLSADTQNLGSGAARYLTIYTGAVNATGGVTAKTVTCLPDGGEGGEIRLQSTTGGSGAQVDVASTNEFRLYNFQNTDTIFFNNAAQRMRLSADGHLFPSTGNSQTLGTANNPWSNVYGQWFSGKSSSLSAGGLASGPSIVFNWSGQGGQPTWLWGGNTVENMYVYNPANFSVNYANSAGTVNSVSAPQVGAATAGLGTYAIGSYVFAKNFAGGSVGPGGIISGASLEASNSNDTLGGSGTLPGSWRLHGWVDTASSSLWVRVS